MGLSHLHPEAHVSRAEASAPAVDWVPPASMTVSGPLRHGQGPRPRPRTIPRGGRELWSPVKSGKPGKASLNRGYLNQGLKGVKKRAVGDTWGKGRAGAKAWKRRPAVLEQQ